MLVVLVAGDNIVFCKKAGTAQPFPPLPCFLMGLYYERDVTKNILHYSGYFVAGNKDLEMGMRF